VKSFKYLFGFAILLLFMVAVPRSIAGADSEHQTDLTNQIADYFNRLEAAGFSGAVLVVKDGEVILREGYGLANDADGTAVSPDTVFDAGSIAKQFTATAVLHLEEQGLLSVSDSIAEHLDNVPADKAGITIHQLLTHSAGLAADHSEGDLVPMTRDEALQVIFAQSLTSEPGAVYSYSNSGYTLLAAIVESVSGEPFPDFLRQTLWEPVALNRTGFYQDARWSSLNVATAYPNGEDYGSPAEWPGPYWGVLGNGGVLTTVDDLYSWWDSLQRGTVLSQTALDKLFTPHILEEGSAFYGYGWTIVETEGGRVIRHNGGGIGGNSDFAAYTDQNLIIIVMSNRIVYRTTVFDLPYDVNLAATEASKQLATNMKTGDFFRLPQKTFSIYPYLAGIVGLIATVTITVGVVRRRRRTA
jgi:CubicO group peptidase (beta-lactamase class C family)